MSTALENTFKSKITIAIIILFALLLFGCGFMSMMIYQGTSRTQSFFNSEVISASYYELNNQYEINNKLLKISNDKNYDINNAYVEVDPYKTSPLSGIIIFYTKDEEQIRVYINNKYVTTMESSKKHIIPIYGLLSDADNTVRVESSKDAHDYTMHTDKVDNNEINSITWLSNGHYVASLTGGSNNNYYNGYVEKDYLGKIYNYYILRDGFVNDLGVLPNGNMIALGIVNNEYIIYTFDPRNGDVKSQIDMYGIVKGIDDTFDDKYLNNETLYNINYIDDKLYISNNDLVFVFDINNIRLLNVYSSNNIFDKNIWSEYINEELKEIDLSKKYDNKLYYEVTDNININYLKSINNLDKESLKETNYKKVDLDKIEEWTNTVDFTDNLFLTDYDLSNHDVDLYFINRAGKIYIMNYLNKDSKRTSRVYNVSLPIGQYAFFIKVDDKLYKTNKIYQF